MKTLCSVTLSSNRQEIIADAIRSVKDWVDFCVIIDLGITDNTILVAKEVGPQIIVAKYTGSMDDAAEMRNFGLQCAASAGADVAVMLDTDERINTYKKRVRKVIKRLTPGLVIVCPDSAHTYRKERFFGLPFGDQYTNGEMHEHVATPCGYVCDDITFDELPKPKEVQEENARRMVGILKGMLEKDPTSARLWFLLGEQYTILGHTHEALNCYWQCKNGTGPNVDCERFRIARDGKNWSFA